MHVEPLMPDRLKVKDETKRVAGVYAMRVDVHFRDASAHQT